MAENDFKENCADLSELSEEIRIAGVVKESIVDGPGIRYVVFVQGCPHGCEGCHNPATHDFSGGYDVPLSKIFEDFKKNPLLSGVTFSGGEPFCKADKLLKLGRMIKSLGKSIVIYSGYTFEELLKNAEENENIINLLKISDILIDGRFELKLKSLSLRFRGSSNQRVIDLKKTFENYSKGDKSVALYEFLD
ncbi:MAG TPA: anaerobic ribonucleoside-triphosphate reductase activating protein [Firmicutes bacterium]|nr:anaerobic ribonucleoside-triphosphate reductase activating protein [Bacillota bacterium]